MAKSRYATPACPDGHVGVVSIWERRQTKSGLVLRWRCTPADGSPVHKFRTRPGGTDPVSVIKNAIPVPPCPLHQPAGPDELFTVQSYRTYRTRVEERQRYRCTDNTTGQVHTFSTPLPRAAVTETTECPDCHIPTPYNAGAEAIARRHVYPISTVIRTLRWLSEGQSYSSTSLRILDEHDLPTGRSRTQSGMAPQDIDETDPAGPARNARAHWHVAADLLEVFGPAATEIARVKIAEDIDRYRSEGQPVVYIADDLDVWRQVSQARNTSQVIRWHALVVARRDFSSTAASGHANRLTSLRALPRRDAKAWALVLEELPPPDFLVADASAPIGNAYRQVWGTTTTFVPCLYHIKQNLIARICPPKTTLPDKILDHVSTLNWHNLGAVGDHFTGSTDDFLSDFFDQLQDLLDAAGFPKSTVPVARQSYLPQLQQVAAVAQSNKSVPLSNAGAEALISRLVKQVTGARRGPMFTNLARTNLLCELLVAGNNGVFDGEGHRLGHLIQERNRNHFGWAAPTRGLTEPAGTFGLQDPDAIRRLTNARAAL